MRSELTHIKTEMRKVFGSSKVMVDYELTTSSDDADNVKSNLYNVTGEVKGLGSGDDCRLEVESVTPQTNNEDTLVDSAIEAILVDKFNWA